jgi:outer membrane lipoprotein carrier protein
MLSVALLWVGLAAFPAAQGTVPSAADLAAKVQAHYSTVRDFTADWSLRQSSALRPVTKTERGTLKIKKPLKMRWTYTTSDKNEFISDGVRVYQVYTEARYFEQSKLPPESESSTWLLFLAGRGDLTRDFIPSMAAEQPDGEWRLALQPRATRTADFKTLTLEVDRKTYQMRGLVVLDDQGSTSAYRFTNLKENQGLSDREFAFTPPRGFVERTQ